MLSYSSAEHKSDQIQAFAEELGQYIHDAAGQGLAVHVVEKEVLNRVLKMGGQALDCFFAEQGDGDLGETFQMPDGRVLNRLELLHTRSYQSILRRILARGLPDRQWDH